MTAAPSPTSGLLAGRSALVTGGAAGIGRAIATALAGAGAQVCIGDLDAAAGESAAAALGRLDILCANAGISSMNRVADLSEAEWDANLAVNAKGVFLTNQAAVRLWLAAGQTGVIVNTASVAGKTGAPLLAHYCASKFAVIGFTQSLAKEVAGVGIRVNCVCPGYVRTSMQQREVAWE